MSTEAVFVDEVAFEEGMKSVRDDSTSDRFIVAGHEENDPNRVKLINVGQNTADFADIMDNCQVMYALARYESKFDMSTTIKFVYFHWVGDDVPATKKGRFGVVHGSVEKRFSPYHMVVQTSSIEDFDDDKIMQQLEETAGTKSKVIESMDGRQERGFTASQLPKRGPSTTFGVSSIATGGANFEVSEEVYEQIIAVRSDESPVTWLVACYENADPKKPIVIAGSGEGDFQEMRSHFSPDAVMYGLFRGSDVVDDIPTVKFVFITWMGSGVKPMTRAKVLTHKGAAEQVFGPAHVTLFASDLSDVTEKIVMDKITNASGSMSHVK